jgi:predicted dehydrogenase
LNQQFAAEMDLPYIPDLDEALAREDVDIASVCTEQERRGRVAVRCAQAGKHLYLDKPMTSSVEYADAVVAAVEEAGVYSQMFSFIHYPWVQEARKAVESGAVGEIVAMHCDVMFAKGYPDGKLPEKPRKEDPRPERFTFIDSKRELNTTGIYAISLIRWIADAEVRKVFCVTSNYFFAEHRRNQVEDFGVLALTLDNGIVATVACGRIGWTSHPAGGPNRLYIFGTESSLMVDANRPRVEVYADEPPWTPPPASALDPMSFWRSTQVEMGTKPKANWIAIQQDSPSDASRFIDYIESGRESEMSARDGAASVETLMAGYMSAAKGNVVSLPIPRSTDQT